MGLELGRKEQGQGIEQSGEVVAADPVTDLKGQGREEGRRLNGLEDVLGYIDLG